MFVDTNVFMYAVGREHPLKEDARDFFRRRMGKTSPLFTSSEVMQELLHAYVPVGRIATLDAALTLLEAVTTEVWPVGADDIRHARALLALHPTLGARDLVHLACCQRREVKEIRTYDRALGAVARGL